MATSGGTAAPGVNYTPINQVVNFAAGQNTQSITIPVKNVGTLAQTVTVNVILSSPSANASLGGSVHGHGLHPQRRSGHAASSPGHDG